MLQKNPGCNPVEIATYFLLSQSTPYVLRAFNLLSSLCSSVLETALLVLLPWDVPFAGGRGERGGEEESMEMSPPKGDASPI